MAKEVFIDDVDEGMQLAQPVINTFGQVLIPAGAVLKNNHITLLKTWSIESVKIAVEESEEQDIPEEIKELALDLIVKRLKWRPENDFEIDLIKLGLQQITEELLKSGAVKKNEKN